MLDLLMPFEEGVLISGKRKVFPADGHSLEVSHEGTCPGRLGHGSRVGAAAPAGCSLRTVWEEKG